MVRRRPSWEVRNLAKYSPLFREQSWQPRRIKDTNKGPQVGEIKWAVFWRKAAGGLPSRRHCLMAVRNVLTGEMRYFVANRVPGEARVTLRKLLREAFGRWSVEASFREANEELGMDYYDVRGWLAVHRHFFLTQLSQLFCAQVRQQYDKAADNGADHLTEEQLRSEINTWLSAADLTSTKIAIRKKARSNDTTRVATSKHKRLTRRPRITRLATLGIDIDRIISCIHNTHAHDQRCLQ